jgi:hypothetical protein
VISFRVILDEHHSLRRCFLAEGIHKGASNRAPLWIPSAEKHPCRKFFSSRMTQRKIACNLYGNYANFKVIEVKKDRERYMSIHNKTRQFSKMLGAGLLVIASLCSTANAASEKLRLDPDELASKARTLNPEVMKLAVKAYHNAYKEGLVRKPYLVVIDYSKPSHKKRMWVFDLYEEEVVYKLHVTHGVNSGNRMATRFSNRLGSLQTSLGTFVTQNTYDGRNGYSLRLQGLEPGINDMAKRRGIVIHGANYASQDYLARNGKLGRSWGCPAIDTEYNAEVIELLEHGSVIFAYYPDEMWLASQEESKRDA